MFKRVLYVVSFIYHTNVHSPKKYQKKCNGVCHVCNRRWRCAWWVLCSLYRYSCDLSVIRNPVVFFAFYTFSDFLIGFYNSLSWVVWHGFHLHVIRTTEPECRSQNRVFFNHHTYTVQIASTPQGKILFITVVVSYRSSMCWGLEDHLFSLVVLEVT